MHNATDVVGIFNDLFIGTFNTKLIAGGEEPIYLPAKAAGEQHRLVFSHDYFSSALHEVSHWCIAGAQRRELVDFGYWYAPDGRSAQQQQAFEGVEVKPQALEWIFSMAAGIRFRVSVDNLNAGEYDSSQFTERVRQQVMDYLSYGLPERGQRFTQKLLAFYQSHWTYADFCIAMGLVVASTVSNLASPQPVENTQQQVV